MDKLLALRTFVEVADAGGFSKAARKLGVSTSSATRLLDALEEALGTALLTRSTRAVTLTDAGAAYLEQITRVLADLDEADSGISEESGEPVGPLRVSMPATFGRLCLGPHIARFMQAHPRVVVDIVLTDAMLDLASERIDVAVRIGVLAQVPRLVERALSRHHRYVVASHDYLERAGVPVLPEDLARHECLRFAYTAARQRWTFHRGDHATEVDVGGRLLVNSSDMLREAALGDMGIALLPQWLVGEDVRTGRLRRLFEDYAVNPHRESVSVYAAYLPNRRRSRKVQAFLQFLSEHVGFATE